jgi:hypothetical protein
MLAATAVQDAYDRAQAAYTKHLNKEERARINEPMSFSTLISQAKTMETDLRKKNKDQPYRLIRFFGKKATTLEPLEKLVEAACRMVPLAGGMIWGSVSFILQVRP